MKVCIVAPYLYPYLNGQFPNEHIGGAEFQQQQIINALNKYPDIDISVITLDYGQTEEQYINGIRILKTHKPAGGVRFIRFFYPRLFLIWNALVMADSDIYYLRAASFMLLPVALYCKIYNKKMVYAAAHDTDFQIGQELVKNIRDLWCYRIGLRHADLILTQTRKQLELLDNSYGLSGEIVRNFSAANQVEDVEEYPNGPKNILWVATIRRFKRAELFLDIAQRLPQYNFVMVGGRDDVDKGYYYDIKTRALKIKNLSFKGFVPPNAIDQYFAEANLFINTSIHEGFPNTFLQAWSRGTPVITFFDPDNIVQSQGLGIVVTSIDDVVPAVFKIMDWDKSRREEIRNYFVSNHTKNNIKRLRSLLFGLADKSKRFKT